MKPGALWSVREFAHRAVTGLVCAAIGWAMPRAAMRYAKSRERMLADARRTYMLGKAKGPNQNWRPANRSGDAEIHHAAKLGVARARDLDQNNPYICGGLWKFVNNVVLNGIFPQAVNKRGQNLRKDVNDAIEALWWRWSRGVDMARNLSMEALQGLVLRTTAVDGEIFVVAVFDERDKAMPLRLRLIERDQLDESRDGTADSGNELRRGIEYDPDGRIVAYYFLPYHPGDVSGYRFGYAEKSVRVEASRVLHMYRPTRASQSRGMSWLTPVGVLLFDLEEYENYEIVAAKVAASFGVFVTSGDGIGGQGFGGQTPGAADAPRVEAIDPGRIQYLNAGEKIETADYNRPGDNYQPFVKGKVRAASAGMGMSYQNLSNDYSDTNYSSARQAILEERRGYRCIQHWLNQRLNQWVYERFLLAAYLSGNLNLPGFAAAPDAYAANVNWIAPGWEWIDPLKDANATEKRISMGLTSRQRECAAQGADFYEIMDEQAREKELMDKLYPPAPAAQNQLQGADNAKEPKAVAA